MLRKAALAFWRDKFLGGLCWFLFAFCSWWTLFILVISRCAERGQSKVSPISTTLAHQSVEQCKYLTQRFMGSIPILARVFLCPCVGPYPLVRVVQYSQIDSVGVSSDSNGSICESERVLCGWLIERGIFIVISAFLLGLI